MPAAIDDVIDFITERDPRFPQRIEGVNEEEIDGLADLLGRPLPQDYRAFLARLGRGRDWLALGAADFDFDTVLRAVEYGLDAPPPGYLRIGRARKDPSYDFYLWSEPAGCDRVVSFPPSPLNFVAFAESGGIRPIAGTIGSWIGGAAIRMFRLHRLPARRDFLSAGTSGGRLPALDAALAPLGLAPLFFSDDWSRSYESETFLISAAEFPGFPLVVSAAAADLSALDRLTVATKDLCAPDGRAT